ncbi:MAG: HAMP domain-containing histidine kinase [Chloroflexi bacterium]|nr:HAMP domain-containing histidine kinase [Chloroflexota bacterium]
MLATVIVGVFLAGAGWLVYLLRLVEWSWPVAETASLFTVLVVAAGLFPLQVGPRIKATVTTAALFPIVLLLPPGVAALAAVVGGVAYQVVLRFPWYKYPFNAGQVAISVGLASWAFHALAGDDLTTPAVAVPVLSMFLVNSSLVSLVAAVQTRATPLRLWWRGTRENGLAELSLFAFGYLAAVAYHEHPVAILALLVPVFIIYFAFSRLSRANMLLQEAYDKLKSLEGQVLQNAKLATVGAFTLDLSHQLKNPLFIVIGRLESLQRRMSPEDPMAPKIDEAVRAAWRMNELAEAFLSVARQRWVKLNLVPLLEEAIGMSTIRVNKSVTIERAYDVQAVHTEGHPILLREALSNLVSNAVEAVPAGGKVRVELSVAQGEHLRVSITDSGPGMPQAQYARLFEPFNTSKRNGIGLGLFSAKHIVEMHHGCLNVESVAGQGTRVEVQLPATPVPEEEGSGSLQSVH